MNILENGAQIEFTSADGVDSTKASSINSNTVATLVRINGTRVFESLLSITVLDSFPTTSVTCSVVYVKESQQSLDYNIILIRYP